MRYLCLNFAIVLHLLYINFELMKVFIFLMAINILVLSLVPCGDIHSDCSDITAKTELSQIHDHQQDTGDNCSIFCTCSCCSASIVTLDFKQVQLKKPTEFSITQKLSIRNFSLVSNFYGNIWQPPKIAC
ncbi:MAG: hypothetical protein RL621_1929 [Bacteroidota bacterium]